MMLVSTDEFDSDLEYVAEYSDFLHLVYYVKVLIEKIDENEDALSQLNQWEGEYENPYFNCKALNFFQKQGYNIYRINPYKRLSKYRLIYAFDVETDEYLLLSFVEKPSTKEVKPPIHNRIYNYEPDSPITNIIRDVYDSYDIPKTRKR